MVLTACISLYPHLGLLGGGSMLRLGEGVRWATGGTGGFFGVVDIVWWGAMLGRSGGHKTPAGTLLYNKWQKVLDIWVEVCKN